MPGQSTNPLQALAYTNPQLAGQQYLIARQQALGQQLLAQGQEPLQTNQVAGNGPGAYVVPVSPFAGATKVVQSGLGSYLLSDAAQQQAALANQQAQGFAQAFQPAQAGTPAVTTATDPSGGALDSGASATLPWSTQNPNNVIVPANGPQQAGALAMPGMTGQQAMTAFAISPQAYGEGLIKNAQLTDDYKNALAATGGNQAAAQQLVLGDMLKKGEHRPGDTYTGPDGLLHQAPANNPNGIAQFDQSGNFIGYAPAAGANAIAFGHSAASTAGTESVTPAMTFNPDGSTNFSTVLNNAQMGGASVPGISQAPQPVAASPRFSGYAAPGAPTAPNINPAANAASVQQDVAANQPQQGPAAQVTINGGQMSPSAPPGSVDYASGMAKAAGNRVSATIDAASDSPIRQNVLQNIIDLSKSGVLTGPGQDIQNAIVGHFANLPGAQYIADDKTVQRIAKYQDLEKFLNQNGARQATALGLNGTDASRTQAVHASPNSDMYPQALQDTAAWQMAAESAIQAKANAQDAARLSTPAQQQQFENNWRNAMDLRLFQMQNMDPGTQQRYFAALPLAQQQILVAKGAQLHAMGALQ